jgi:hypothetical protein
MPRVPVKSEYTRFRGGLDLESPALSVDPGALLKGMNYMCNAEGGYERIDGYERFSGKPSPSAAVYYYAPCTFTAGGPAVGDTIAGASSGSTAVVVTVGTNYINYTKRSAAFTETEVFRVGATAKGTFTATGSLIGETSPLLHATALNLAADQYRADIAAPAGTYPVRGLAMLAGVLYAFVDDSTGNFGEIYKSTASGWSKITLYSEISFSAGTGAIVEGNTITQVGSGATALVMRVALESGTWAAGTAAGRLIIGTITGTFNATNLLQVGGVSKATASSLATAIAITKGGRYECIVYNFTGSTATRRIYGCDGVNHGFEFDGTIYVPIHTGMATDTPTHVSALKDQLIFSFLGSSQNSAIGEPFSWTVLSGAGEIALGETINGYSVEAKTLLLMSRNETHQLFGENIENFVLDTLDAEMGAIPWTIQSVGSTYCLDDRGIIQILRAQEFGNFSLATVSRRIQSIINNLRKVVVASSVYRSYGQYRLYGSDGTGICMTVGRGQSGLEYYFTEFVYPVNVSCVLSTEDSTGRDAVFFGSTTGMVYQADRGSSFDGSDIEGYVWLPFNHSKSPEVLKSYRKLVIEGSATGYASLRVGIELSYGDPDLSAHPYQTKEMTGGGAGRGGFWDTSNWDEFYYDFQAVASPAISIAGDGTNISVIVYSKSDIDLGHKLDGVLMQYIPRRLVR